MRIFWVGRYCRKMINYSINLRNPPSKKQQNKLSCISFRTHAGCKCQRQLRARDIFIAADKKLNLCQHFGHWAGPEAIAASTQAMKWEKNAPGRAQLHTWSDCLPSALVIILNDPLCGVHILRHLKKWDRPAAAQSIMHADIYCGAQNVSMTARQSAALRESCCCSFGRAVTPDKIEKGLRHNYTHAL